MHPSIHAKSNPDKPAIIMAGSGETISFAELDRRSNQVAQLLRTDLAALHRGRGVGLDQLAEHVLAVAVHPVVDQGK